MSRNATRLGIGPRGNPRIGNPITNGHFLHTVADRLNPAGAFHPDNSRQGRKRIKTGTVIYID
jgi:hypothetical protein